MAESWAPTLDGVARHIPTRTRDSALPGSDVLRVTFTATTTPTAEQAQASIDGAVNSVLSVSGVLPGPADAHYPLISQAARIAAEWRAAADIELAYPNRDADVQVYAALNARAEDALATLLRALVEAGESNVAEFPVWMAPPPPPWADLDPGSGTRTIPGFRG